MSTYNPRSATLWEAILQFEWDPEKAAQNVRKHGVSFDWAKKAFDDPFAFEWSDDWGDYGEERCITIGMIDMHFVVVVSIEREQLTRLISARQATKREIDEYFRQNSRSAAPDV